ncbi:Fatty-acid amide hydrolase 1 [Lamellibrachia satsuma]|nr:Fatty-acid amide hydrolase 1 [Lamellibrachia satsuma]
MFIEARHVVHCPSIDTTNPIFGLTVNPHDTTRTAGGSSGGEAALIAGGGSILGFGTDLGGSVRIPAAMCGIYSLRPVDLRLSEAGSHPMLCGQKGVPNSYGPMARDVESLAIAMKALTVDSTMYEVAPATPPVPFRSQIYEDKKRLKIGFFLNNGVFRAVPCMERAVLKARVALEAAGHQLVEYNIGSMGKETFDLWTRNFLADGGVEIMCYLKNDAVDGAMRGLKAVYDLNGFLKKILYHISRRNDMKTLQVKHPDVFRAFCEYKFTVNKTHRTFARMPLDKSHEQNIVCVKEDGGEQSALLRSKRNY